MSEYQQLKQALRRTPILIADDETGEVDLIAEGDAIERMAEVRGFDSCVMIHAGSALEAFADLSGVGRSDRSFDRKAVAQIAGMSRETLYAWMRYGVLPPTVREGRMGRGNGPLWSWSDAFVAGLFGALSRRGVNSPTLFSNVYKLFTKQIRTSQQVAAR